MAEIIVGQTITTQQYANADNTSLSYYLNAYLFYVDVTLISQDIVNALSKVRIKHRMKCVRSYYSKYNSLHSDISIGDEVKNTKYLPTAAKGQTYDLAEWTGDVPHDSQGNLSIVVKGIWHGYDNNNNYGPVSNTLLNEIQFPQILRASTINVSPTFLTSGNATIMVTKHDPAYTTTLKYRVNNVDYVIATKSSNTTFYLAYNTIKNIIGSYTSAVVKITAITYSGNTILGEDSKEIIIQTGSIPLSLYDDMQGNTGVTFGEEATGAGARFKMPAYFDDEVYGIPIPDPPSFTAAWSGVCKFGSTITCTIPNTAQMIICRWLVNTYHSTLAIPVALLNSTMTRYIVSDDSYFAGGELKLVDTTLTYKGTAYTNSNCYLKDIYYM